jgi:hypothetical protein
MTGEYLEAEDSRLYYNAGEYLAPEDRSQYLNR